ncbi:hypothetical protein [Salinibacter altiplanensis]|uniref:hypothetical protein n=1 Tax=Salinibacter altiplanensis TaxID=1803181 RepID=UPI001F2CF9F1|nr:hypothetical protein [Salinibacter altiplanensis]
MNRGSLDAGYLIALGASDDQHHEEAIQHWRQSVPDSSSIVTTTYVLDAAWDVPATMDRA